MLSAIRDDLRTAAVGAHEFKPRVSYAVDEGAGRDSCDPTRYGPTTVEQLRDSPRKLEQP